MQRANFLLRFLKEEDGPTAVEYAAMLALIVITCLMGIRSVGSSMEGKFNLIADSTATAPSYPVGGNIAWIRSCACGGKMVFESCWRDNC